MYFNDSGWKQAWLDKYKVLYVKFSDFEHLNTKKINFN